MPSSLSEFLRVRTPQTAPASGPEASSSGATLARTLRGPPPPGVVLSSPALRLPENFSGSSCFGSAFSLALGWPPASWALAGHHPPCNQFVPSPKPRLPPPAATPRILPLWALAHWSHAPPPSRVWSTPGPGPGRSRGVSTRKRAAGRLGGSGGAGGPGPQGC